MKKFNLCLTVIFCSDQRLDNAEKVLNRLKRLLKSPFTLTAGEGTDGTTTEDSFIFIQYNNSLKQSIKTAHRIRKHFKQDSVIMDIRNSDKAYLLTATDKEPPKYYSTFNNNLFSK